MTDHGKQSKPSPQSREKSVAEPSNWDRDSFHARLYRVIFEAETWGGKLFDVGLLLAIAASIATVAVETVPAVRNAHGPLLIGLEWSFTILFSIEYALRLYCVKSRRAYATSFYGLVDLLSILPTYVELLLGSSGSFAIVRAFRLLRVFRIFKLFHLSRDAEEMGRAVWKSRGKVIVFLSFVVVVVTVSGTLMYEIERYGDAQSKFDSIPQSIYWAIVTMTTVGYGDIVPNTMLGKIVSAILILIGYSLIIVPTGFVSAEVISLQRPTIKLTRVCPGCLLEGHATEARFCRACGHELTNEEVEEGVSTKSLGDNVR